MTATVSEAKQRKTHGAQKETVADIIHGVTSDERQAKIGAILEAAHKTFGKESLGTLRGQFAHREKVQGVISTGSIAIDEATGIGGVPRGRVVEIYGPEAGGKTTLTLHLIAEVQKKGGIAAFVDAEHALDPVYASAIGIDLEQLLLSQPDSGEQALQLVEKLVESGNVDLIIIDSVAALVPLSELNGEIGNVQPGAQARLMSQALRMLTAKIHKSNCVVIFINQIRMKIGVSFGSPETTSGGNALKFYASLRLDIRRIGGLTKGEAKIGNRVKVKVAKNKLAPPFKTCEVDIIFGEGVSVIGELLDLGSALKVLTQSGAWFSFNETRLGLGRDKASTFLKENPTIAEALRTAILEKIRLDPTTVLGTDSEGT